MHARYYTFNLGRFMSVDPVGGTVGLSQSWNRYAYVRGNPVNATDPDGETVTIAAGKNSSKVREMLVEALRRRSFLKRLSVIANDPHFSLVFQAGSLNTDVAIMNARLRRGDQTLQFGETVRKMENFQTVGAVVTVDVKAVGAPKFDSYERKWLISLDRVRKSSLYNSLGSFPRVGGGTSIASKRLRCSGEIAVTPDRSVPVASLTW